MSEDGASISPEAEAAGQAAAIAVGAVEQSQEEEVIAAETREAAVTASVTAEVAAEAAANAETTAEVAAEVGMAAGAVAVEAGTTAEEAKTEVALLREETAAGFAQIGEMLSKALTPPEPATGAVEEVTTNGTASGGSANSGDSVGDSGKTTGSSTGSGTGKTGDSPTSNGETPRRRGFSRHH